MMYQRAVATTELEILWWNNFINYIFFIPFILASNPHPNLIRAVFADFLNEKNVGSRF
jgi:hypothetical protein